MKKILVNIYISLLIIFGLISFLTCSVCISYILYNMIGDHSVKLLSLENFLSLLIYFVLYLCNMLPILFSIKVCFKLLKQTDTIIDYIILIWLSTVACIPPLLVIGSIPFLFFLIITKFPI